MLINEDECARLSGRVKKAGNELGIDLAEDCGSSERFSRKCDVGGGIVRCCCMITGVGIVIWATWVFCCLEESIHEGCGNLGGGG